MGYHRDPRMPPQPKIALHHDKNFRINHIGTLWLRFSYYFYYQLSHHLPLFAPKLFLLHQKLLDQNYCKKIWQKVKKPPLPPGFAYSIRHCVAQSEYGPVYKIIYNKCLDHKLAVMRHAPGVAISDTRITFRKFRFLGIVLTQF